jgi:hypothetical protein
MRKAHVPDRPNGEGRLSRQPESLVLELLRNIRADVARLDDKIDGVKLELRSEIQSLRADVAADLSRSTPGSKLSARRRASRSPGCAERWSSIIPSCSGIAC